MITFSIDVTLLDKAKFKEVTRKSGVKALFCDIVMIETPNSDYGDYMVKQGISKEEREKGVQMPILGNAKIMTPRTTEPREPRQSRTETQPESGNCPF